jgi:predicted nucleic acid-binding Zn ribbon protein
MERSLRRRRRGHPQPIGEALERLTKSLGIEKQLDEHGLVERWPQIVGERIAEVTTAQRLENGVLLVAVTSAPWRAELTLQREQIARMLNEAAGKQIVREIRFR